MRKPLYRSRTDRMLFGVAGGMAEWLEVDPSVVRLVWALLVIAGGVGILLYIVAAFVVPEAPAGAESAPNAFTAGPRQGRGSPGVIFGIALVIVGSWLLLRRYLPAFDTSWVVPGVLIVLGIMLVVGALNRSDGAGRG